LLLFFSSKLFCLELGQINLVLLFQATEVAAFALWKPPCSG